MNCHRLVTLSPLICLAWACPAEKDLCDGPCPATKIDHVVIVVQENHTFDSYFAKYCSAANGSAPTCNAGPTCCEAGPAADPGTGDAPIALTDTTNGDYDRNHTQECELDEIDDGKMDRYVSSTLTDCGDPRNFAYASGPEVQPYWQLAGAGALADRYFQPIAGQSSSNDMYLACAHYLFTDDTTAPEAYGHECSLSGTPTEFHNTTIADLLVKQGVSWAWYAEGYANMVAAQTENPPACPPPPAACPGAVVGLDFYPCIYDPSDVPFEYFPQFTDNPKYMKDFTQLGADLDTGHLPQVVFVKPYGFHSEHPGYGDTISAGATFVTGVVSAVEKSSYANRTLVLVTWDEGGGFFDHVSPPPTSTIDNEPYGTRIPLLAVGPFARKNFVSHVTMEHSSLVKFLEWNWLGKTTGQLGARDTVVNNIGSLLDPDATGTPVPEN